MNADDTISESEETLQEFMDEKVKIEGGINPVREKELRALLQEQPGVQAVSVAGDEVSITYDPTKINSKEIHAKMRSRSFTPGERAVTTSEPPLGH
jgi:allophanate hydrolase subunit 1